MPILICCPSVPYEVVMREKKLRPQLHSVIRYHVRMRDEGRCTHIGADGKRCSQTKFLEIHHIVEVSAGGSDNVENLTLLCSRHHQALLRRKRSVILGGL